MTWITGFAFGIAALAAALFALATYGSYRWTKATHALLDELEAARLPATASRYHARELEGLPAPVQRYFRAVLKDGQRIITGVTVGHAGTFNVRSEGEQWMKFTSEQRVLTHRPGFVWNARVMMAPAIAVLVHDAYVAGVGTLHAAVMGLFSLAKSRGAGEIARGEMMRYMMESAWYPTALLPSQGVTWSAVDDISANATMADGDISVTMLFTFDAAGLIEVVHAASRGAMVGRSVVMTPWQGRMSNYQEREGMRVPLIGEAAWVPAGTPKPYWRGTIMSLKYEFAAL